eukprot:6481852-Alexandrium_andersonii.AAC.1
MWGRVVRRGCRVALGSRWRRRRGGAQRRWVRRTQRARRRRARASRSRGARWAPDWRGSRARQKWPDSS